MTRPASLPVGAAEGPDIVATRHWKGQPSDRGPFLEVTVVVCTYKRDRSMGRLLRSLGQQQPRAGRLVIVDATPDPSTERVVEGLAPAAAGEVLYLRVGDRSRGLTRQRALGLSEVATDLVVFCDDDIELRPGCLDDLVRALRREGGIVAAIPCAENEVGPPSLRWRLLHLLGAVPSLRPGRYYASGISVPWRFQAPTAECVDGDWLFGSMMAWRTEPLRALGFSTEFEGYGNGEDLDLTLRARDLGRRVLVGAARIVHHHDAAGRPDSFELGYTTLRNNWLIHRRSVPNRSLRHVLWFGYATGLLALFRAVDVIRPSRSRAARAYLRGQAAFLVGATPRRKG